MRHVAKGGEPKTLTETRCASTTDLSRPVSARSAFDQIDKAEVRRHLVREQGWLCAFCMRRIDARVPPGEREPTMKIAHRIPVAVDPSRALDWRNLFGSCDGGQRAATMARTCDYRQGEAALTIDPADPRRIAQLRYERRGAASGLFLTSDDLELRRDVEETLNLNGAELPLYRATVWEQFLDAVKAAHPKDYWEPTVRRAYFPRWRAARGERLPEYVGVVERKLGLART